MARIIDLSQPIEEGASLFPTLPPIRISTLPRRGAAVLVKEFSMADHASTHIDALAHFRPGGDTIEKMPLEYCYGEAVVLDFSHKKSGETITAAEVREAARRAGVEIRQGDIVLFRTGADRLWGSPAYIQYAVGVGVDAVRWLVAQGVKVLGVDAVSIDADDARPAHQLVNEFEYYHIENLANLDQIPRSRFKFAAFPLKLVGGSGGPLRAVAILDD